MSWYHQISMAGHPDTGVDTRDSRPGTRYICHEAAHMTPILSKRGGEVFPTRLQYHFAHLFRRACSPVAGLANMHRCLQQVDLDNVEWSPYSLAPPP
jgi:hypothetical protein